MGQSFDFLTEALPGIPKSPALKCHLFGQESAFGSSPLPKVMSWPSKIALSGARRIRIEIWFWNTSCSASFLFSSASSLFIAARSGIND